MRAPIVIAASVAGLLAGAANAWAADLPVELSAYRGCCDAGYGWAVPIVIYDDEPGVVTRSWWLPPWRNRHYFPHGAQRLKTSARLRADRRRPHPGRSYTRYWTNPPVYLLDSSPLLRHAAAPPRQRIRRNPSPAAAVP